MSTATTLIRLGSFTLLTDPNYLHQGQRAYLGKGHCRIWCSTMPSTNPPRPSPYNRPAVLDGDRAGASALED